MYRLCELYWFINLKYFDFLVSFSASINQLLRKFAHKTRDCCSLREVFLLISCSCHTNKFCLLLHTTEMKWAAILQIHLPLKSNHYFSRRQFPLLVCSQRIWKITPITFCTPTPFLPFSSIVEERFNKTILKVLDVLEHKLDYHKSKSSLSNNYITDNT